MQLLAIRMHGSGTSVHTHVLILMAAYVGREDSMTDTGIGSEHPDGAWKRRYARDTKEALMAAVDCDQNRTFRWDR